MKRSAVLAAAVLGALAAPARAQLSPEAAWRRNSERFDGIFSGAGGSRATQVERPSLFMDLKRQAAYESGKPDPGAAVPILPAEDSPKKGGHNPNPWGDRQDFAISSIGLFGLPLLGVQSFFKDVFWLTLVATALVCCYFLLSAPIF